MERKEEVLWRKLKVEVNQNSPASRIRRASTDGLPHFEIASFETNNDEDSEISSPTFKKPHSVDT